MKFFLILILFISGKIFAQLNPETVKENFDDAVENAADQINESVQTEIPDELLDMINHPLNVNSDNLEIFVRYNLITSLQLSALIEYRIKNGSLIELQELQQVDGFDKKSIQNIIPYLTLVSKVIEARSHQITIRYQKNSKQLEQAYPGSNEKVLFRYRGSLTPAIKISFTGEKDPGETYFTKDKKGFDFNSFNIFYKGKSVINKLIIGDYNIEYGQGLTAWTGLSFSNASGITGIYKFGRGIIPYSGTDENRFLRGVAVSVGKNHFRYDVWISGHAIDGNIINDTITKEEYISSLQTSGYHRTNSEIQDYHSQYESVIGSAIFYNSHNLKAGLTSIYQDFKLPVTNNDQPYAKFEFSGNNNYNIGLNFNYTFKNILFFGESAFDKTYSNASIAGAILSIDPKFSIGYLWRSYDKDYVALKSNAFGVNTKTANELGNYFGIVYKILRPLTFSGYIDLFSFEFIKYRVDKPSQGFDFFNQLEYIPTKKFTAQIRYRRRLKQVNMDSEINGLNPLANNYFNNLRFSTRFKIDNSWEYNFRIEYSSEINNNKLIGSGTMVSQDLFYHPMGKPYSANCRYAVFNCPQFDTRIYEYENDVQGAFSIPSYYGKGSRFYTNLNYKITSRLTTSLRYSITWIENSFSTTSESEIKLQLHATFR